MSVVNTELRLKVKRVTTFILKCFLQFACTNLDGSQKEGDNFLNLLQKEGVPSEKGGVPTLEESLLYVYIFVYNYLCM